MKSLCNKAIKNQKFKNDGLYFDSFKYCFNNELFTSENMGFTFEELVDCLINITMSYIEDDRNKVA